MSELEAAAQPILTPILLGQSSTISELEQLVIARWAVKTSTMFHYGFPSTQPLPDTRLQQIRHSPEPPSDTWVWLAPSAGSVQPAEYEIKGLDIRAPGAPDGTHGELFTLCVGQLAIQVFSIVLDDVQRNIGMSAAVEPVRIWPVESAVLNWPPPFTLDDDQIEQLFVRFTPGEQFPFDRRTARRQRR